MRIVSLPVGDNPHMRQQDTEPSYPSRPHSQGMQEYGPDIVGEVRFARQDGGYYVQLYDREGTPVGKTGLWRTEAKAKEAARRLAAKMSGE